MKAIITEDVFAVLGKGAARIGGADGQGILPARPSAGLTMRHQHNTISGARSLELYGYGGEDGIHEGISGSLGLHRLRRVYSNQSGVFCPGRERGDRQGPAGGDRRSVRQGGGEQLPRKLHSR